MTQERRTGGRKGVGEGASAAMINQRARQQLAHGRTSDSRDERIDWIIQRIKDYTAGYEFNDLRKWTNLEKDILQNEMRRIQVEQYRGELVPSSIVLEIRNATIQLIQDTLGDAYIANLVNLGLGPEDAKRGYDDMMLGLRALYAEFVQRIRDDENGKETR